MAAAVMCTAMAACSGNDDKSNGTTAVADATVAPEATDPPETAPPETAAPDTAAPDTSVVAAGPWETVTAPADCMCTDGSEFSYFVRKADPTKVMFFLEGGGACFSAETCGPTGSTFKRTVLSGDEFDAGSGIFDATNPMNPFANYSIVYVPYCSGDVHIGNVTRDYGDGVVAEHKGFVNASTALDTMVEMFPGATELVVTGESAGSIPTPLYAGLASDLLPDARITVLADGSGAYQDLPEFNANLDTWGTTSVLPDWPMVDGAPANWSLPSLFVRAAAHDPQITFARHDYAYDAIQTLFSGLLGVPPTDLLTWIDQNETTVEAGDVTLWSYTAPGASHTVLSGDGFYSESVEGVLLVDWVTALINGEPIDDVRCTVCTG